MVKRDEPDTRERMLDAVEKLMVTGGYPAVTYRAVAAEVGVTGGSVQYYFPTLDDLLTAAIRRRVDQNVARLADALDDATNPLRVLWDYSSGEAQQAITHEFMALANHRKSIKAEIGEGVRRVRDLEFAALDGAGPPGTELALSRRAMVFLVTGIPKLLQMEGDVGIDHGHAEIVAELEQWIDAQRK